MFEECMYFNTSALARRLEREWAEAFRPFGLAPPQAFMLRAVLRRPGALQSELAEALAIARPTATRALDGLEEKKLITRESAGGDGRTVAIHPTEKGRALGPALNEASAKVTARLKRQLGEPHFKNLVAGIREVRGALK